MSSAQIDAVVFDMDGVLCRYDFTARLNRMACLTGCPAQTIRAEIFESGWDEKSDRGVIDSDTYIAGCAKRLGVPLVHEAWLEARAHAMTPDLEVLEIARSLAARMPVAVLTNNNRILAENLAEIFPEVPAIFGDQVYVSAVLGLAKPNPAVYLAVISKLGAMNPARALFIDDRGDYIAGAQEAGLRTHHFMDAAGLRVALSGFGLN